MHVRYCVALFLIKDEILGTDLHAVTLILRCDLDILKCDLNMVKMEHHIKKERTASVWRLELSLISSP